MQYSKKEFISRLLSNFIQCNGDLSEILFFHSVKIAELVVKDVIFFNNVLPVRESKVCKDNNLMRSVHFLK